MIDAKMLNAARAWPASRTHARSTRVKIIVNCWTKSGVNCSRQLVESKIADGLLIWICLFPQQANRILRPRLNEIESQDPDKGAECYHGIGARARPDSRRIRTHQTDFETK